MTWCASGMTDRVFVYAIRRRSDGLFSTGGSSPKFTKKGKRWSTIGHVKAHLSMFVGFGYDNSSVYAGCELVAFEISTVETEKIAMEQLMETYFQERKEREQLRRLEYQRQKTVAEIRKLAELKAKYEVKR